MLAAVGTARSTAAQRAAAALPPQPPCYDNGVFEYSLYPYPNTPPYHIPITMIQPDVGGLVDGSLPDGKTKQECFDYINAVGTYGDLRDNIIAALWSTAGQSDFCNNHADLTASPVKGNCKFYTNFNMASSVVHNCNAGPHAVFVRDPTKRCSPSPPPPSPPPPLPPPP